MGVGTWRNHLHPSGKEHIVISVESVDDDDACSKSYSFLLSLYLLSRR